MHRFFVPPSCIGPSAVELAAPMAHQIANVLRLRPGEHICVLDNSGWEVEVELVAVAKELARGRVVRRRLVASEPAVKITLYQGMLKADRFEFALQKCTELGAVGFVPLITARTVLSAVGDIDDRRAQRWRRIAIEAAEQAGRGRLPVIHPAVVFQSACEEAAGLSLIPWEEEHGTGLRQVLRERFAPEAGRGRPFAVNLFVGPEGGFTAAEVDLARRHGITPVTMGPRILRAETAAAVATAAVLYEAGELGG